MRVRRRGNKNPFRATTPNVAVENYFYKLQPVTDQDLTLIRVAMLDCAPSYVRERCELIIHNFTVPLRLRKELDPSDPHFEAISSSLDEHTINLEEELHCDIEGCLIPALDDMLNGSSNRENTRTWIGHQEVS